jgi:hypothetical protein
MDLKIRYESDCTASTASQRAELRPCFVIDPW